MNQMTIDTTCGFIVSGLDRPECSDPQRVAAYLEDLTLRLSLALCHPFEPSNVALVRAHCARRIYIGNTDQDDTHGLIPCSSNISVEEYIAFAQARSKAFPGWRLLVARNLSVDVAENSKSAVVWMLTCSTMDEKVKLSSRSVRAWRENICKAYWAWRPMDGRWTWWKYEQLDGPGGFLCGDEMFRS
jgi:hypothetical protein